MLEHMQRVHRLSIEEVSFTSSLLFLKTKAVINFRINIHHLRRAERRFSNAVFYRVLRFRINE
jgi:hypothetical protein